ncbi:glutamine-hydrolyzing carbamoyl-phosphate synthase small subunit [Mobiluncus holmesii]|uniref:Carbamoyl phosphate synthase small chain n=2 Tax=Mobiluncus porci TaxID=2652278 RepID=A0A7K0K0C2_9ACTO|nr:glutamine-hydrolyzing carbamoyl-phosphate synthase small subunit [Mobiluncus porci]
MNIAEQSREIMENTGSKTPDLLMDRPDAVIVLEDGFALSGKAFGAAGRTLGEVVFTTGMTGYQESLTDPSYHKQILVMTAPHIGNTGMNTTDPESSRIWVAGFVVRDPARRASNWRAEGELEDELVDQGIVGICDLDTRALTLHIREKGALRGGIFSADSLPVGASKLEPHAIATLQSIVRDSPQMAGAALTSEVTTDSRYVIAPSGQFEDKPPLATLAAVDLGIKSRTPEILASLGVEVHIFPASSTLEDLQSVHPDGVFFSNGPGDPAAATREIELLRSVLDSGLPYFGICFGNQLLGRALGYGTYKLVYGHRGVNQPVLDRATGKVEITSHNHGFAVDMPLDEPSLTPYNEGQYGRAEVTHVDLNDNVVEGLKCLDIPAFSVQYHPEAAAGPHDASHLFTDFLNLMLTHRQSTQRGNN